MIGASTVVNSASSRWETSSNVRSRTSSITACNSATTGLNILVSSHGPVKRYGPFRPGGDLNQAGPDPVSCTSSTGRNGGAAASDSVADPLDRGAQTNHPQGAVTSDEPAEPDQREAAGGDEERDRAAREDGADLVLLALGREPRAEVGVDLLDLVGLGGRVGLAAGEPGDLLQGLGVRRDLDALEEAERVAQLDRAAGRAERDRVDRDPCPPRLAGDVQRLTRARGVLAVAEQDDHRGQAPDAAAVGVGDRRARGEQPALEAVAHRR